MPNNSFKDVLKGMKLDKYIMAREIIRRSISVNE